MESEVKHIKEFLDESLLTGEYYLGSKFGDGTLLIYLTKDLNEWTITIEKYFEISRTRKVKLEDFKQMAALWI